MDSNLAKQIVLGHIEDYLDVMKLPHKHSGKVITIQCPFCKTEPLWTATKIAHLNFINCRECDKKYTLIDIAKKIEDLKGSEEDTIQHIVKLLKLDVITKNDEHDINSYFEFYRKIGFDLVPVIKNGKRPIEQDWTNKEHKDIEEWNRWINTGLNIGVKTGIRSGVTILDIDQKPIPPEIKVLMGDTLVQESTHGFHLIYQYEESLPKTRINDLKIDIENDGGQVVFYPSKIDEVQRTIINLKEPIKMPEKLLKFLKEKITVSKKTYSESMVEDIQTENFKINLFEEGTRNSSLIKLGGVFRKEFSPLDTKKILHILNNHNHRSGNRQEIEAMSRELEKYTQFDEADLANKIMTYLKTVEIANRTEIAMAIAGTNRGEQKKRVDVALAYLVKEEYVVKRGSKYEIIRQMDWTGDLLNIGTPVDFKVPYFHNWAYLNKEDLIIIGSRTKFGKTTLAMNIVDRLIKQGIKPDYIYNESGGRFAKTALKLGMKNGDFESAFCSDPDKIILRNNKVVVFDWVKPTDFARTDKLFSDLVEKIKKTHGFMICFVQLRTDNSFFAKDQIGQFPSLVAKYTYNNEEGTDTKFEITDCRDPKIKGKHFTIPCQYDWETYKVKTIYEIEQEKK